MELNVSKLNLIEWTVIGYEEYRLGHNHLLKNLKHLVSEYHDSFNAIVFKYQWLPRRPRWPPNHWHLLGCTEAWERWFYLPQNQKLFPLESYLTNPRFHGYHPKLHRWPGAKETDACAWCRKEFTEGFHIEDALQEHVFCCQEHGLAHRRKIVAAMPTVQAVFDSYQFKPLPVDPSRMLRYFNSLPDTEQYDIAPIVLPEVERGAIEFVTGVSSGKEEAALPKGVTIEEGVTLEDD